MTHPFSGERNPQNNKKQEKVVLDRGQRSLTRNQAGAFFFVFFVYCFVGRRREIDRRRKRETERERVVDCMCVGGWRCVWGGERPIATRKGLLRGLVRVGQLRRTHAAAWSLGSWLQLLVKTIRKRETACRSSCPHRHNNKERTQSPEITNDTSRIAKLGGWGSTIDRFQDQTRQLKIFFGERRRRQNQDQRGRCASQGDRRAPAQRNSG